MDNKYEERLGTDALAGIGVTSSIIILISAFSQIVGGGGAPLASIALGKGDRERAHKILGNGFSLLVLFTVVTSGMTYIFMDPLLRLIGASDSTIGYAADYLSVYLIGTLFVMFATGLNSFINAQGRPGISMIAVIVGAVLNIGIIRSYIFYPLLPWDYFFHYVKKFFSLCCSLSISVFHIAECYLFHFFFRSAFFLVPIIPYFCFSGAFNQRFPRL